jgi:hypothetical protein
MNCKDFKAVVNELVYNKIVDAETRQTGFAHAAMCANCAMLLSETQDVRAALRLTVAAEAEEAPVRVKESLLAAFAEQRKVTTAPATVVSISSRRKFGWLSVAALAAAAVLLIALLLPALLRRSSSKPEPPKFAAAKPEFSPAPQVPPKEELPKPPKREEQAVAVPHPRRNRQTGYVARASRTPVTHEKTSVAATSKKTTNQFLPLTYLASSTAMESGTVVRVKLSRSSLISLGLPVSSEGADEMVKADLIVGDDGVARAIRLVEE